MLRMLAARPRNRCDCAGPSTPPRHSPGHHIPRRCGTKEISEPEVRRSLKRVGHRDFARPFRPIANRPKEVGTLFPISRKQAESLSRTEYLAWTLSRIYGSAFALGQVRLRLHCSDVFGSRPARYLKFPRLQGSSFGQPALSQFAQFSVSRQRRGSIVKKPLLQIGDRLA